MSQQTLDTGDRLVRIGAIVFMVGAVGTIVTVAPLLLGTSRLPTPAYFVSMLMGAGLAVALVGLLRTALAQRPQPPGADDSPAAPAPASVASPAVPAAPVSGGVPQAAAER